MSKRTEAQQQAKPAVPILQLMVQWDQGAGDPIVDNRQLRRWVMASLQADAQLTLRAVGLEEGQQLNRDFRQKDYATNVLTFPYQHHTPCMADIVICMPVVEREAAEQNKSVKHHLAHMVIHACLHAQGYDHETDEQAHIMEALEVKLLQRFRIHNPYA